MANRFTPTATGLAFARFLIDAGCQPPPEYDSATGNARAGDQRRPASNSPDRRGGIRRSGCVLDNRLTPTRSSRTMTSFATTAKMTRNSASPGGFRQHRQRRGAAPRSGRSAIGGASNAQLDAGSVNQARGAGSSRRNPNLTRARSANPGVRRAVPRRFESGGCPLSNTPAAGAHLSVSGQPTARRTSAEGRHRSSGGGHAASRRRAFWTEGSAPLALANGRARRSTLAGLAAMVIASPVARACHSGNCDRELIVGLPRGARLVTGRTSGLRARQGVASGLLIGRCGDAVASAWSVS